LKAVGTDVVAISVDNPEKSREMAAKLKLAFPLLSDIDHKVIDAYDLYNAEGKISKPATFVLDTKGIVRWSFFEEDYKVRPLEDVLFEELKKIK
jgi:thioredoxin-dependent peroxiredoxin